MGVSYTIWKVFESTFRIQFRLSVRLSVCTTIFKWKAGLHFYPKSLMLYINGSAISSSSYNGMLFFKFWIRFRINWRKPKNIETNSQVWILTKVQCFIYQWICLDKLYKVMESFFLQNSDFFRIFGWKPKNIRTNNEAWILINFQCVIYQWICLDKLYKLI